MQSTAIHCQMQYSNRFDNNCHLETQKRAGNDKIIESWQVRLCRYAVHCSAVVVIHVSVYRQLQARYRC